MKTATLTKPVQTDSALISEFRQGNESAFAVLVKRHKSRIYTTIYLIVKDRETAMDLYQDCLLKAVELIRAGKYAEEGKFLPWMIRIARNKAIDHFRKSQRNPMIHSEGDFDAFKNAHKAAHSVETTIIRSETSEAMRKAILCLPSRQREVLIMRHYSELSFKEIAELTDVSINTALGRMRYAIINLKRIMGAELR